MKSDGVSNQTFINIFLRVTVIASCVQVISRMNFAKPALANVTTAIILGLLVYGAEILIAKRYLGNRKDLMGVPFKLDKVLSGIVAFLLVLGITTLCVQQLDQNRILPGQQDLPRYLFIFFLNLVPSAMTEEWLFRFFPTVLVSKKRALYAILFYIGVTFLFMLMHFPKYYLEGNWSSLPQVFISGIVFLLIYKLTQNLPFVILVHAFTNHGWFIYESTSNWLFLYAVIVIVTIAWAVVNFRRLRPLKQINKDFKTKTPKPV